MANEITIRGGYAGRIEADAGELLEIVNIEGRQICDFFAFQRDDLREHLSPAHTRAELLSVALGRGDRLFSVHRRAMFEILEDTVGRHDIVFPACDPERYKKGFGIADHRSCRANLAEVMRDHAIPFEYLPDPVNFFQNTPVQDDGSIAYGAASIAEAGDKVVLRALTDVIAVGSSCAMDLTGINGERLTDIRMIVRAD